MIKQQKPVVHSVEADFGFNIADIQFRKWLMA